MLTGDRWAVEALRSRAELLRQMPRAAGRPGQGAEQRRRLGDLYVNMRTADSGVLVLVDQRGVARLDPEGRRANWSGIAVPWRLAAAWDLAADSIEGRPADDRALLFEADCPSPMEHAAALRNLARFMDMTQKAMRDLLRREDRRRAREGGTPLDLPPARKREPSTSY